MPYFTWNFPIEPEPEAAARPMHKNPIMQTDSSKLSDTRLVRHFRILNLGFELGKDSQDVKGKFWIKLDRCTGNATPIEVSLKSSFQMRDGQLLNLYGVPFVLWNTQWAINGPLKSPSQWKNQDFMTFRLNSLKNLKRLFYLVDQQ